MLIVDVNLYGGESWEFSHVERSVETARIFFYILN